MLCYLPTLGFESFEETVHHRKFFVLDIPFYYTQLETVTMAGPLGPNNKLEDNSKTGPGSQSIDRWQRDLRAIGSETRGQFTVRLWGDWQRDSGQLAARPEGNWQRDQSNWQRDLRAIGNQT